MIATIDTHLPGRAVTERRGPSLTERLQRGWQDYQRFLKTRAELRALPMRAREDVGLAGEDLDAVAREATYGHG